MSHARQQIREHLVSILTGLQTTGTRVSSSRTHPHTDLPDLTIYTLDETVLRTGATIGGIVLREVSVAIEARAKPTDASTPDNAVDQICSEVERVLGSDTTADGYLDAIELSRTTIVLDGSQEREVAKATMIWRGVYRTVRDDPDTILSL